MAVVETSHLLDQSAFWKEDLCFNVFSMLVGFTVTLGILFLLGLFVCLFFLVFHSSGFAIRILKTSKVKAAAYWKIFIMQLPLAELQLSKTMC